MKVARVESRNFVDNVLKITIIQLLFSDNLVKFMQAHFSFNLFLKNSKIEDCIR